MNYKNPAANSSKHVVPSDTYYAYGGGGQFVVMIPSLNIVVASLYGGKPAEFHNPPDLNAYDKVGRSYFPLETDKLISDTDCDGGFSGYGCWNITFTGTAHDGKKAEGWVGGSPTLWVDDQD